MCKQYMTLWDSEQFVTSIACKVFVAAAVILSAAHVQYNIHYEHFGTRIKWPVLCAAHDNLNGGCIINIITRHELYPSCGTLRITLRDVCTWHLAPKG